MSYLNKVDLCNKGGVIQMSIQGMTIGPSFIIEEL